MADLNALKARLGQIMVKAEQLEPGGDLAGLIAEELAGFNRELAESIVQQRETTTTCEGSDSPLVGCENCRHPMRPVGVQPRRVKTPQGELAYRHTVHECPACRRSRAPLDAEMGVGSGQQINHSLLRKVAWSAAQMGFADASANLAEMIGFHVSAAECQRVALDVGEVFDAHQRREEAAWLAPVSPDDPAPVPEIQAEHLVLEADAASVLTRADEQHKDGVVRARAVAFITDGATCL